MNKFKPHQDNDVVTIKILDSGEVTQTVWRWAKTQIESGSAILIEQDKELMAVLKNPSLFNLITEGEFDKKIVDEKETKKAIFLVMCGIFVENQKKTSFTLGVNDESGVGKDYITTAVSEIFPDEILIHRTRLSEKALNYWKANDSKWDWNGKILSLSDISKKLLNSDTMKSFLSEGSQITVVKDQEAQDLTVNGRPTLILTFAEPTLKDEQLRRIPIIECDSSINQTEKILEKQGEYESNGISIEYNPKIMEALSILQRVKVHIPYAKLIALHFPSKHVIARTNQPRFFDLIRASASLHQFQRKKNKNGFIIATKQDYEIAKNVLKTMTSNPFGIPQNITQKKIIRKVKEVWGYGTFVAISDMLKYMPFISEKGLRNNLENKQMRIFFDEEIDDKRQDINGRKTKPAHIYALKCLEAVSLPEFEKLNQKPTKHTEHTEDTGYTEDTDNEKETDTRDRALNVLKVYPEPKKQGTITETYEKFPDGLPRKRTNPGGLV